MHVEMIPGTLEYLVTANFQQTIRKFGAARHALLIGHRHTTVTPMTTHANGRLQTAEREL